MHQKIQWKYLIKSNAPSSSFKLIFVCHLLCMHDITFIVLRICRFVHRWFFLHKRIQDITRFHKGTTIWYWGGQTNLVRTDYLISSGARLENLFPGKPMTEYLFSTATNYWKSKKKKKQTNKQKKKKKKNPGRGWGLLQGFSIGARTWISMFCITFCRLLERNNSVFIRRNVWYWFFSIYVYDRI